MGRKPRLRSFSARRSILISPNLHKLDQCHKANPVLPPGKFSVHCQEGLILFPRSIVKGDVEQ